MPVSRLTRREISCPPTLRQEQCLSVPAETKGRSEAESQVRRPADERGPAGQGFFHGQLAPSPSGVASAPKLPQLSLSALRATAVVPLGVLVL